MTIDAVRAGFASFARSPLHTRACTSTRSPCRRSPSVFLPWRRTFVWLVTAIEVGWAALTYAFAQWFPLVTVTLSAVADAPGVLASEPLRTTVIFGLQPAPVA